MDTRLANMARNGDRGAFAQLVDIYKDKIYHLAYRMMGNAQEAEDVVQETFLRVYTNLDRYDEQQKFSTWMYRIATNLCIDRLRKRRSTYSLDAEMQNGEGNDWYSLMPSNEDTPENQLILSETQSQIKESIESLPEKYKSILILRYFHDLSLQEISEIVNMPVTTIKTRLHRGREYLKKKLETSFRP
jgi:RNA polymerase sigma-70 factor (ECF subfamily)